MRKIIKKKCLVNNCQRAEASRGLCQSCYNTARKMIKNKEATEQEFIEKGMMRPSQLESSSNFRQQFELAPKRSLLTRQFLS